MGDKVPRWEFIETHALSWTWQPSTSDDAVLTEAVSMNSVLRWSWLLGVALMTWACRPEGGPGVNRSPGVVRRPAPAHRIRPAPAAEPPAVAPRLSTLKAGSSLRLLRRWSAADGQDWLHVQTLSGDQRRGWIRAEALLVGRGRSLACCA